MGEIPTHHADHGACHAAVRLTMETECCPTQTCSPWRPLAQVKQAAHEEDEIFWRLWMRKLMKNVYFLRTCSPTVLSSNSNFELLIHFHFLADKNMGPRLFLMRAGELLTQPRPTKSRDEDYPAPRGNPPRRDGVSSSPPQLVAAPLRPDHTAGRSGPTKPKTTQYGP
jgi:hypothetical protein